MLTELLGLLVLLAEALVLLVVLLTTFIAREARRPPRHTAAYALARRLVVDPEDAGLEHEQWRAVCPDGVELPVWEIRTGSDNGRTAVLVHGWGQSRIDMLARLEPWRELFERVVLYDLRGHGDAEDSLSRLGDREELDLLAIVEQLGAGPVHLIGWSMGANIALAAAADSRIAGVIAYGAYLDFHTALRGRIRGAGLPTRPMTDLAMLWFRARGLRLPPLLEQISGLTRSALIIHGRDDRIVPIEHGRAIAAAVDGATLLELDAGHGDVHLTDDAAHDDVVRMFVVRTSGNHNRCTESTEGSPSGSLDV